MENKGNKSDVGEGNPTDKSMNDLDNMVDDVIPDHVHSSLNKEESLDEPEKKEEEKEEEEVEEEGTEEEETTDESDESKESDDSEEEVDEEVVPASKYKKLQEKTQRRINELTAEISEVRLKEQSEAKTQSQKLEQLSIQELNELRENVDESIMDAKVEARVDGVDNSAKLAEYKELKRNIEATSKNLPNIFAKKQATQLNKMIETVKEIDPNVAQLKGELWNTAKNIYGRMPSLQKSETGQAEALAMAAEYYIEKKSMEGGREKVSTLSRKVTSLKKKAALDGGNRKGNEQQVTSKKLRDKAVNGDYYDKLGFIGTLIPEDYLS